MTSADITLPDLRSYPALAKVFDVPFQAMHRRRATDRPDYLFRVLCDSDPDMDAARADVENLLEAARGTGIADADLLGRLKSEKQVQINSAFAELESNLILTSLGLSLTPRPLGARSRLGDLQIEVTPPVFVEIKAIMNRELESIER